MKATIYKITSLSGKFYIGSTRRKLKDRIIGHKTNLVKNKHHSPALQNAWNKYESLEITILEEFEYIELKEITDKEQYYIDLLKPEYNICKIAYTPSNNFKPKLIPIIGKNIITKEIFEFNSVKEAEKILKIDNSSISCNLNNKCIQTNGFVFKYKNNDIRNLDDLIEIALNKKKQKQPIIGKNIITKEIVEFESILQAEKILKIGRINNVLSGSRWQTSGFIFKYKNDESKNLDDLINDYLQNKGKNGNHNKRLNINKMKNLTKVKKINIIEGLGRRLPL